MRRGEVSFWYRDLGGLPLRRAPLAGDTVTDVCIVGAGYTGLWSAYYLKRRDPSLNIQLQPGDIVMIPFERTMRIYVTGAVRNPNVLEVPEDEPVTVLQAIAAAGGTTERANETRITVIRRFPNGAKRLFEVNLKKIKRGREQDLMLVGNDTVVVKEAVF